MPRFKIIKELPVEYRPQILDFWQRYLPGTPHGRLEWMENNPAGPSIWLLAIDNSTDELAGTLSVFPKKLYYNGKEFNAAILGDFMLPEKYRVFGPTLSLFKAAATLVDKKEFDFLYTIPNKKSEKIVGKMGFHKMIDCLSLTSPQRLNSVIEKHFHVFSGKLIEIPFLIILKLLSRTTYTKTAGDFSSIISESELNQFFKSLSEIRSLQMSGEHNLSYFKWRYFRNPAFDFKIITYKSAGSKNIDGFFIYTIYNNRLELYDFDSFNIKTSFVMLKKLNAICRAAKCRGIYVSLSSNNPLISITKKCCFINTKDTFYIYTYPKEISGIDSWSFISADKNV